MKSLLLVIALLISTSAMAAKAPKSQNTSRKPSAAACDSTWDAASAHPEKQALVKSAISTCQDAVNTLCGKLNDGTGDGRYVAAACGMFAARGAYVDVRPAGNVDPEDKCDVAFKKGKDSASTGDVQDADTACTDAVKAVCKDDSSICAARAAHAAFKNASLGGTAMYCGKWEANSTMHDHQSFANGGYVNDGKFNAEVAYDNGTDNDKDLQDYFGKIPEGSCTCLKGEVSYRQEGYVFDYVCGAYTCNTHKPIKGHCK